MVKFFCATTIFSHSELTPLLITFCCGGLLKSNNLDDLYLGGSCSSIVYLF